MRLSDVADSYEEGETIQLAIVDMDARRLKVQVSLLPLIERMHEEICGRAMIAEGEIKEMQQNRVRFVVDPVTVGIHGSGRGCHC